MNDEESLRELIFEICWDVFRVSKDKLILDKFVKKGRRKNIKSKETFVRFIFINWISENQNLTREETGRIFSIDHSSISYAIKISSTLVQNRDIEFCTLLDRFNLALKKRNINTVKCDIQIKKSLRYKLTKDEKYHLKFMLENNISINKLANHLHVGLHVIRKFKNSLDNDSK